MRLRKLFGLSLVVALLAGTALTIGVGSTTAQDQPSFPVQIRFLNAMTAQKTIDVYVNGSDKDQRVVEGLEYGTISENFTGTSPATNVVVKNNVNLGFDQWLFNTVVPTEAGRTYLVVVSDFVVIPVMVDNGSIAAEGATARLVHAASQAPSIDVLVNDEVAVTDLKYGRASDAGNLPAGTYNFKLNATGTENTALEADGVELADGNSYTFVAIGKPGSTEQPLILVVDVVEGTGVPATPSTEGTPTS